MDFEEILEEYCLEINVIDQEDLESAIDIQLKFVDLISNDKAYSSLIEYINLISTSLDKIQKLYDLFETVIINHIFITNLDSRNKEDARFNVERKIFPLYMDPMTQLFLVSMFKLVIHTLHDRTKEGIGYKRDYQSTYFLLGSLAKLHENLYLVMNKEVIKENVTKLVQEYIYDNCLLRKKYDCPSDLLGLGNQDVYIDKYFASDEGNYSLLGKKITGSLVYDYIKNEENCLVCVVEGWKQDKEIITKIRAEIKQESKSTREVSLTSSHLYYLDQSGVKVLSRDDMFYKPANVDGNKKEVKARNEHWNSMIYLMSHMAFNTNTLKIRVNERYLPSSLQGGTKVRSMINHIFGKYGLFQRIGIHSVGDPVTTTVKAKPEEDVYPVYEIKFPMNVIFIYVDKMSKVPTFAQ